ncbi:MAG: hypothetical protein ACI802_003587, partial [Candidatus Paceibacteria bacterium]
GHDDPVPTLRLFISFLRRLHFRRLLERTQSPLIALQKIMTIG